MTPAPRIYIERVHLLAESFFKVICVTEQLDVSDTSEYRNYPEEYATGKNQQTNMNFLLLHGSWFPARAPCRFQACFRIRCFAALTELQARLARPAGPGILHFR